MAGDKRWDCELLRIVEQAEVSYADGRSRFYRVQETCAKTKMDTDYPGQMALSKARWRRQQLRRRQSQ